MAGVDDATGDDGTIVVGVAVAVSVGDVVCDDGVDDVDEAEGPWHRDCL